MGSLILPWCGPSGSSSRPRRDKVEFIIHQRNGNFDAVWNARPCQESTPGLACLDVSGACRRLIPSAPPQTAAIAGLGVGAAPSAQDAPGPDAVGPLCVAPGRDAPGGSAALVRRGQTVTRGSVARCRDWQEWRSPRSAKMSAVTARVSGLASGMPLAKLMHVASWQTQAARHRSCQACNRAACIRGRKATCATWLILLRCTVPPFGPIGGEPSRHWSFRLR